MKKKAIVSRHVLADKIPLICAAVLMFISQLLPNALSSQLLDPFYEKYPDAVMTMHYILVIVISIIILILFERWFYPEYEGSLHLKGLKNGMMTALPVILVILTIRFLYVLLGFQTAVMPGIFSILGGLRAGINEETAFRGIAAALLLRRFRNRNNIWIPAVSVGILFGLTHITNLFSGDTLENVMVNFVFSAAAGVLFGILFTFSGNILPLFFVHSLYDTLSFCFSSTDKGGDLGVYAEIGVFIFLMIIYLIAFFRNRDKAVTLWNSKWSNTIPSE